MGFVTPGKRKLLNSSPNGTKNSKRSSQTISGIISGHSLNQSASSNTRSAKRIDPQQQQPAAPNSATKRVNSYSKNHIKNNVEFMQKSATSISSGSSNTKLMNSGSSNTKLMNSQSSKFLSTKLRNNSNYINNNNNIANNNTSKPTKSPKSQKVKKHLTTEQSIELNTDSGIQICSYTKENLQEQEDLYAKKLSEFKYQLEKLNKLDDSELMLMDSELILNKIESSLFDNETIAKPANSEFTYFKKFIQQLRTFKRESEENMSVVENWYQMQKSEVTAQYNLEHDRAIQEFQDKRRELKDSLKTENEDKKRQIEIDRNLLDINMDITDAKPKVTRKLRRRNNNASNLNTADVDSSNSCLDTNSSLHLANAVVAGSSLLQNNTILSGSLSAVSILPVSLAASGCTVTSQFASANLLQSTTYYASTCTSSIQNSSIPASSSINERKKAKLAPITLTLSEDDINEDLKQLC